MSTLPPHSSPSRGQPRPARATRSLALADLDSRERWIATARAERSRYLAELCTRLARRVRVSFAARDPSYAGSAHA